MEEKNFRPVSPFIGNMVSFPSEKRVKLDMKDRKILFELSINPRFSNSFIGKKTGLPRETVAYRIEQLKKKGILTGSIVAINPKAFGLTGYEVHFELKNFSMKAMQEILDYLIKHPKIRRVVECGGKSDIAIVVLAATLEDFQETINRIKFRLKDFLTGFSYYPILHEDFTYYGFFLEGADDIYSAKRLRLGAATRLESHAFQKEFLEAKRKPINNKFSLDELDKKIIREIETDAMMSTAELARRLGVSHNTAAERLRALIKGNVILTAFPMVSISLLGFEWHQVLFNMDFRSKQEENSFISYCINHPYIVYYLKYAGRYNYKISIFAKNTHHLHEILIDIRNRFQNNIVDYEPFIIFRQHKYSYVSALDQQDKK